LAKAADVDTATLSQAASNGSTIGYATFRAGALRREDVNVYDACWQAFKDLDRYDRSSVSAEDLAAFAHIPHSEAVVAVVAADKDGDGRVGWGDFLAVLGVDPDLAPANSKRKDSLDNIFS
jgi:hypothetical protein